MAILEAIFYVGNSYTSTASTYLKIDQNQKDSNVITDLRHKLESQDKNDASIKKVGSFN